jgi:hypothetical protein
MGFRALCLVAALNIYIGAAQAQAPGPPGEVISSARVARTVTPTRYVYISQATACTLAVILADDTAAVTLSVPAASANAFLPIRAKVVMATGTTCTPVVGLW